jgi:hypothetical protein
MKNAASKSGEMFEVSSATSRSAVAAMRTLSRVLRAVVELVELRRLEAGQLRSSLRTLDRRRSWLLFGLSVALEAGLARRGGASVLRSGTSLEALAPFIPQMTKRGSSSTAGTTVISCADT